MYELWMVDMVLDKVKYYKNYLFKLGKKESYRKYYLKNKEKRDKNSKKYYQEHKEEHNKYKREYYRKNKDKVKEWNKKWVENNPEKRLKIMKKHLKKYGKLFNMNSNEFMYALNYWSKTTKKLDNRMCKNCDSRKNIQAHHIMPKSDFPKLSLDLDNGITLCRSCHEEAHGFETY